MSEESPVKTPWNLYHDLSNPLGIVRGHCEMFLLNDRQGLYQDKSSKEIRELMSSVMKVIISQTDRALEIAKEHSRRKL